MIAERVEFPIPGRDSRKAVAAYMKAEVKKFDAEAAKNKVKFCRTVAACPCVDKCQDRNEPPKQISVMPRRPTDNGGNCVAFNH